MTFQTLDHLIDAFVQLAIDTRRAKVTDLLLMSDLDDGPALPLDSSRQRSRIWPRGLA